MSRLPARFTGLWRHGDFMKLWTGQTISEFGSTVSREALPLAALLTLSATPAQMGLLAAMSMFPVLVVGLPAGVWVDRLRRRPLMVATDVLRALLLLTIPVAALMNRLTIEQLMIVAALAGVLTVLFDVAYHAYLPTLVEPDELLEGNSKLGISGSLAEIAGPAVGGGLVTLITAPFTVLIDAFSFFFSAASLGFIRRREQRPVAQEHPDAFREVREGMGIVASNRLLRAFAGSFATMNFFGGFYGSLYGLYALRVLGFTPALLGVLVSVGGIGSLLGALLAARIPRRFGLGNTLVGTLLVGAGTAMLIALAAGEPVPVAAALLFVQQLVGDTARTIYFINEVSVRQTITPNRLLGRANASVQFIAGGIGTLGLLVGGAVGQWLGPHAAMVIAALGMLLPAAWIFFSPLRQMRSHPTPVEQA